MAVVDIRSTSHDIDDATQKFFSVYVGSVATHHHHRHHHNEQLSDQHSSLRAVLLLLALSLHSLFEGLALGLLQNNDQIISIFSALIVSAQFD